MQNSDSPIAWTDGAPRSRAFGDIYYSLEDGLAETRAVFLEGCGFPGAWSGRQDFTVAELGFGTGLNIAALLHLWNETREPGARLHIFSIEAHPVNCDDARRALSAWPEISQAADALLDRWPVPRLGFQRLDLAPFAATLDLAIMDVREALKLWQGKADAWFLDGFSPELNPGMWREDVLSLVAARSASGARAATFTVAGVVRRGLEAGGFKVEKQPGHGRKRQRLEAVMPGLAPPQPSKTVSIIGAGIAGAALSRAFQAGGVLPRVFDSEITGASVNPAAMVTPTLDAGDPVRARLYAEGLARARALYEATPGAVIARGVMQYAQAPRDEARFDAAASQPWYGPGELERRPDGLRFHGGLTVRPEAILKSWLGSGVTRAFVTGLEQTMDGWRLNFEEGTVHESQTVVIAAGWGSAALAPDLPLQPVRGQASWAMTQETHEAAGFGGYLAPMDGGVLFGATHDRNRSDTDIDPADHARNLAQLHVAFPLLAERLADLPLQGRASIRAATPDRLPLAGEIAPGLFVLSGLGSRGFAQAPLLAEHVAALILGIPSPLGADLAARIDPGRGR